MKYEVSIIDSDLKDRETLVLLNDQINKRIEDLSPFFKNASVRAIHDLKQAMEWLENEWILVQKERVLNQLSQQLNVERQKLCERELYD